MKDKAFARAVKREDITDGAALLGLTPEQHIENCLNALRDRAEELGLQGTGQGTAQGKAQGTVQGTGQEKAQSSPKS